LKYQAHAAKHIRSMVGSLPSRHRAQLLRRYPASRAANRINVMASWCAEKNTAPARMAESGCEMLYSFNTGMAHATPASPATRVANAIAAYETTGLPANGLVIIVALRFGDHDASWDRTSRRGVVRGTASRSSAAPNVTPHHGSEVFRRTPPNHWPARACITSGRKRGELIVRCGGCCCCEGWSRTRGGGQAGGLPMPLVCYACWKFTCCAQALSPSTTKVPP